MQTEVKTQYNPEEEAKWNDHERFIQQYLQNSENTQRFQDMVNSGQRRFPVNLDVLRRAEKQEFVHDLLKRPVRLLKVMQETIERQGQQYADNERGGKKQLSVTEKPVRYQLSFEGNFGKNHVTPRGLQAQLVNCLVAVQGIVTKMSLVRPKLLKSLHHIDATGQDTVKSYVDVYEVTEETQLKSSTVVPKKDEKENPMHFEYGFSTFRDFQTVVIQELPERTPTGQLPRSIEVILAEDLVDLAKPGDRVTIMGVYKCFTKMSTKGDGSFRPVLVAMQVTQLKFEAEENQVTPQEEQIIIEISRKEKLLSYISKSIAPSIYGHDQIKKATLLLLLGGSEKNLETGTHLRGDINMLMIGDPSTAKSQMLRYIMTIAPLAITTTGRGSSSVGLTAAVRRDQETGENVLEAGAMVLADGGVVLIDEFDKMNEIDRVAIHEVMEQQTVTIAKAGIHCSLNARCSVVAAANPIYGEYQKDLLPTKNIGLPDSLLSRFDLLFIVLDEKREDIDRKVAERVTKNHRYRGLADEQGQSGENGTTHPNIIDYYIVTQNFQVKTEQGPFVTVKSNLYSKDQKDLLTQSFLKKYIAYAKRTITTTVLDEDSIEEITQHWVALRQEDRKNDAHSTVKVLPITIRSLEALIRLASAHAKLRLSTRVTVEDCRVAIQLMKSTLHVGEHDDADDDDGAMDEDQQPPQPPQPPQSQRKKRAVKQEQVMEEEVQPAPKMKSVVPTNLHQQTRAFGELSLGQDKEAEKHISIQRTAGVTVSDKQKNQVYQAIVKQRDETSQELIPIDSIWSQIEKTRGTQVNSYDVFYKALVMLESGGKIFFDTIKKEVQLY